LCRFLSDIKAAMIIDLRHTLH